MLANVLRAQSRLALSVCRTSAARLPATSTISRTPALFALSRTSKFSTTTSLSYHADSRRSPEPTRRMFVARLPVDIQEEQLTNALSKFGPVKSVNIPRNHQTGATRGFAFVVFEELEDAIKAREASEAEPIIINDRTIVVNYAEDQDSLRTNTSREGREFREPRESRGPREPIPEHSLPGTVYIRNLPFNIEERGIEEYFSQFGTVADIRMPRHRDTGRLRGYGFMRFENVQDANKVVQMCSEEPFIIQGRSVSVEHSKHVS